MNNCGHIQCQQLGYGCNFQGREGGDRIAAFLGERDQLRADRDSLLEVCEKMAETLRSVMSQLEWQIDYDADPENQSPEDMTAHVNGLIYKEAASALALYASRRNRL